jgi:hypothetical protein
MMSQYQALRFKRSPYPSDYLLVRKAHVMTFLRPRFRRLLS